jgi:hypothetical protein
MIVESMNWKELQKEIVKDQSNALNTAKRIVVEYLRERRKKHINKKSPYIRWYDIKTVNKNRWIIGLEKSPSDEKYQGVLNFQPYVYFYTSTGIKVVKILSQGGGLHYYTGHVFQRYNERMELGIKEPIDLVKRFFTNNGDSYGKIISKGDTEYAIYVCRDGLILAEVIENREWIYNRTFISRNLMNKDQQDLEQELTSILQQEIADELNKPDYQFDQYRYKSDVNLLKAVQIQRG